MNTYNIVKDILVKHIYLKYLLFLGVILRSLKENRNERTDIRTGKEVWLWE